MSREIKFRFWDTYNKEMFYRDLYFFEEEGIRTISDARTQQYEVMQYTGLKDSKGAEIYEGDIVKIIWSQFGRDHVEIQKVQYDASMMLYPFQEFFDYDGKLWVDRAIFEVLGNVYEHPELLNRSKEA